MRPETARWEQNVRVVGNWTPREDYESPRKTIRSDGREIGCIGYRQQPSCHAKTHRGY